MLTLDIKKALPFLQDNQWENLQPRLVAAHETLLNKSGAGNDFLGWRDILTNPDTTILQEIDSLAEEIKSKADVLLCIGIGGSYLGAKAIIEALSPYFNRNSPEILFAGHHMSGSYLESLLSYLEGKSVYVNVISKSGTTLEPALSFRFILDWLEKTYDTVSDRVIVTTDPHKGALHAMHQEREFRKFNIAPDIGGRFSVLTPVGLLPIAVAGIDIHALMKGAINSCQVLSTSESNPALIYAGIRYALLQQGYGIDVLSFFEPKLYAIGGWWQQLFGESEGKNGKGLFPTSLQFSTDLHSMGQYLQEGQRTVIETFLMLEDDGNELITNKNDQNLDKLNYLAGKSFTEVNKTAYEGTATAHFQGGVPNMTLWLDQLSEQTLGEMIYFFEHAVAIGGYLLGVNPFDQPGVEAYKQEMFKLLGKS